MGDDHNQQSDHQGNPRSAWVRAYELVQLIQTGHKGAAEELEKLDSLARRCAWPEVARVCSFGRAVRSWIERDGSLAERVDALIGHSRDDGDEVMYAVGVSMRASFVADADGLTGSSATDADLAEAVVILERATGEALDLITAHTACGIAFYFRSLWELADQQWAAALRHAPKAEPGVGDTLLAAVAIDRLEAQVSWASNLRQIGNHDGLAQRWQAWQRLLVQAQQFPTPAVWTAERDALGLLMAAICGDDVSSDAQRALGHMEADGRNEPRAAGHLTLALSLSAFTSGDPAAGAEAERAVTAIDPEVFPDLHELALYVAAEIEAEGGHRAGLRSSQRQILQRSNVRLSRLGAMQARIESKRLEPAVGRLP